MNNKKLAKQIKKYYFAHDQHLLLATWEMMEDNIHDCIFDIYLADSNIFLFTIQNYNGFVDLDAMHKNHFRDQKYVVRETWDGVKASCTPLYLDRTITLKTFKSITKEDIIHAVDYFVHEILGIWGIFNISFNKEEKEQNFTEDDFLWTK